MMEYKYNIYLKKKSIMKLTFWPGKQNFLRKPGLRENVFFMKKLSIFYDNKVF